MYAFFNEGPFCISAFASLAIVVGLAIGRRVTRAK